MTSEPAESIAEELVAEEETLALEESRVVTSIDSARKSAARPNLDWMDAAEADEPAQWPAGRAERAESERTEHQSSERLAFLFPRPDTTEWSVREYSSPRGPR